MSKQYRKEGDKVARLIKTNKAEFYIADVDLEDNSDDVILTVDVINRTLGKTKAAYMIISAGIKIATVLAYVPPELKEKLDHTDWVRQAIQGLLITKETSEECYTCVIVEADTPFKLKDIIRSNGFVYLSKSGCMEKEESEEEFGFDDI